MHFHSILGRFTFEHSWVMAPKRPPTTAKKGKKKAIGGTSKRPRVETTDFRHYLSEEHELGEVARFLYGRDDAWPLPRRDFEHSKLTDSILILNVFVSHNIDPTIHRTTINDTRARLLYHLAHGRKMDLENYIYTLISMLGFQTNKRYTAIFPALISGIYEAAGVQISPAEPVLKAKGAINRYALENARRHTA
ncbi:Uncharacterized protein Adt_44939 [Abeliophyllum distichum]|uniref:Putative plant transposon protein domain-containing protein n=1 Tax=Abeliophyllum distichum TaxID=126358 RepID=A0ABD1PD06_9LAMI